MDISFALGRIWGIELRVHFLFPIILLIMVIGSAVQAGPLAGLAVLLFMLVLFACVLLHELGHSLVARYYGLRIRHITLWPLGGFTAIDNMEVLYQYPDREIKIALAGPAVNFLLALILTPIAVLSYLLSGFQFFVWLLAANVFLAFLNLLPAFPLDGGRIYRAWRCYHTDYYSATADTVKLGNMVAIGLALVGLFSMIELLLLAIFIPLAGQEELQKVQWQTYAQDFFGRAEPFWEADVRTFNPHDLLNRMQQALRHRWPYN